MEPPSLIFLFYPKDMALLPLPLAEARFFAHEKSGCHLISDRSGQKPDFRFRSKTRAYFLLHSEPVCHPHLNACHTVPFQPAVEIAGRLVVIVRIGEKPVKGGAFGQEIGIAERVFIRIGRPGQK